MEIVIWLLVVLVAAVPAGLLTTFAVVWHERRRLPEAVQPSQHSQHEATTPISVR